MLDDGVQTITSADQIELERRVSAIYAKDYSLGGFDPEDEDLVLDRSAHAKYLRGGLGALPSGFVSLDASRTWICYWITHGLALLGKPLPSSPNRESIVAFLASCQHPEGGFGGGPFQLPHLAPTYAAVAALVTLGGEDALSVVDRPKLHAFLLRMCVPSERGGGMTMHEGGEVDVRGCYCALAACEMLCLDKQSVADACDMPAFIRRCQSHEGGIGGEPWNEAHGGYTFCGLAAAALLGQAHKLDLDRLLRWAVRCQGAVEGGFMGRTNKLVDGCYSFWQGGVFPLLASLLAQQAQQAAPNAAQDASSHPPPAGSAEAAATLAAAERLCSLLLDSDAAGSADGTAGDDGGSAGSASSASEAPTLSERVCSLPHLSPAAAVEARQGLLRAALDVAVEASLEAEDAYRAAQGGAAAGPLQQEAVAALERAADLQRALDSCQQHAETLQCGAATLLDAAGSRLERSAGGDSASGASGLAGAGARQGGEGGGTGSAPLPQLYDSTALQLWLLKCCQSLPRGGLRDKPGKPADYYHTCYCLSGLSSSQHYSGTVLGGAKNLLARADPLCNVVAVQLEAAQRYFRTLAASTAE